MRSFKIPTKGVIRDRNSKDKQNSVQTREDKGTNEIYRTLHRKLMIGQRELH